ncbi:MAG: MerR family transcriptional regulator [Flavobacteriaceae bacterium]
MSYENEGFTAAMVAQSSLPNSGISRGEAGNSGKHSLKLPQIDMPAVAVDGEIGITEMADIFGVSLRTLRFYEEKGLIMPRRSGRQRFYNREHVRTMAVIHKCREVGMPVQQIETMLDDFRNCADEAEANAVFVLRLEIRIADIEDQQRQLQKERSIAGQILGLIDNDITLTTRSA